MGENMIQLAALWAVVCEASEREEGKKWTFDFASMLSALYFPSIPLRTHKLHHHYPLNHFTSPSRIYKLTRSGVDDDWIWKCNLSIVTSNLFAMLFYPALVEDEAKCCDGRSNIGKKKTSYRSLIMWKLIGKMFWHTHRTLMVFFDHRNWIHEKNYMGEVDEVDGFVSADFLKALE